MQKHTALACGFILGRCLRPFVRGCAYASGNGFYLFAKVCLMCSPRGWRWRPLDVTGYALGLTVAARQNGAYARTPSHQASGVRDAQPLLQPKARCARDNPDRRNRGVRL